MGAQARGRELVDRYLCGEAGRAETVNALAELAGPRHAAALLSRMREDEPDSSSLTRPDDGRLEIEGASYTTDGVTIEGYCARPRGGQRHPAVIIIHENRGLTLHIEDVARRFALEGFLAFAPDMLSSVGGTPADREAALPMIRALDFEDATRELASAVPFLASHPASTGKVGAVGYCWGGGMVNRLAAAAPGLSAGAPYYGRQIPGEDAPRIRAALQLHYAELDERINVTLPAYEAALKENNVDYELHMYEGARHAFHNNTYPDHYHAVAAETAFRRTVAFFNAKLASGEAAREDA